ncbi:MAG: hypothetical protein FJ161_01460 [Gammaproteobacteria bacterium]|nr:hypothetical protein [Gammaproteobacteria bacterium]
MIRKICSDIVEKMMKAQPSLQIKESYVKITFFFECVLCAEQNLSVTHIIQRMNKQFQLDLSLLDNNIEQLLQSCFREPSLIITQCKEEIELLQNQNITRVDAAEEAPPIHPAVALILACQDCDLVEIPRIIRSAHHKLQSFDHDAQKYWKLRVVQEGLCILFQRASANKNRYYDWMLYVFSVYSARGNQNKSLDFIITSLSLGFQAIRHSLWIDLFNIPGLNIEASFRSGKKIFPLAQLMGEHCEIALELPSPSVLKLHILDQSNLLDQNYVAAQVKCFTLDPVFYMNDSLTTPFIRKNSSDSEVLSDNNNESLDESVTVSLIAIQGPQLEPSVQGEDVICTPNSEINIQTDTNDLIVPDRSTLILYQMRDLSQRGYVQVANVCSSMESMLPPFLRSALAISWQVVGSGIDILLLGFLNLNCSFFQSLRTEDLQDLVTIRPTPISNNPLAHSLNSTDIRPLIGNPLTTRPQNRP